MISQKYRKWLGALEENALVEAFGKKHRVLTLLPITIIIEDEDGIRWHVHRNGMDAGEVKGSNPVCSISPWEERLPP